jgi:NADPH2:quinone reductase
VRAWIHRSFGPFREVLRLEAVPPPLPPAASECCVSLSAAGLNFPDVLAVEGRYQVKPPLPATPGMEGVGRVTEAGPGSRFAVGDRVLVGQTGGVFAEALTTPDACLFRVPEAMTDREAAGFHVTYQTSLMGLVHRARLDPGETLLVHGAGGGVGSAAVQLGKAMGAHVIATASGERRCAVALASGADQVIDRRATDFVAEVKRLTQGRGVDVVYDPIGGEVFDGSLKVLALEGRLLVIGFASGTIPSAPANRLLLKNISVLGFHWGTYRRADPSRVARDHETLCGLYERGLVKPALDERTFGFDKLPLAMEALMTRGASGKVIVSSQ